MPAPVARAPERPRQPLERHLRPGMPLSRVPAVVREEVVIPVEEPVGAPAAVARR